MAETQEPVRCDVEICGNIRRVFCVTHYCWLEEGLFPPECRLASWNPEEALASIPDPVLRDILAPPVPPFGAEPTAPSRYIWWCTDCREYSTAACPLDGHRVSRDPSAPPVDGGSGVPSSVVLAVDPSWSTPHDL